MNDELEERLQGLRPAEPPPDLMRRLRAAEPSTLGQRCRRWLAASLVGSHPPGREVAGAGLCIAVILALAVWRVPSVFSLRKAATMDRQVSSRENGRRVAQAQPAISGPAADYRRGASFEVGGFVRPELGFPLLGVVRSTNLGGGFPLDAPTGPMRLDCGGVLPGSTSNRSLLGTFNLNGSARFEALP